MAMEAAEPWRALKVSCTGGATGGSGGACPGTGEKMTGGRAGGGAWPSKGLPRSKQHVRKAPNGTASRKLVDLISPVPAFAVLGDAGSVVHAEGELAVGVETQHV